MGSKKEAESLDKIVSGAFSRGFSIFNLTLSTGAKLASLKLKDLMLADDDKKQRFNEFLGNQAQVLVSELGKLKGSIMKAGQMLSVYGERFLPQEVNQILKQLQASSTPIAFSEMQKVLERQLGEKLSELEIDKTPIAAASMGQVYKAVRKKDGRVLALKVQYPGVDKAIDSDLNALKKILMLTKFISSSSSTEEIFKEIRMMLQYEVDYEREREIVELYRQFLKDDPRYIIPETFPEYSGKRVLAMGFEDGEMIDSERVKTLSQTRKNRLAAAFMDLMYREIFDLKTVQTDPHFGNYKIRISDNGGDRIVLLDFGAVRKFPKKYIEPFAHLVISSLENDKEKNKRAGIKLGFLKEDDEAKVYDLFSEICFTAIEGFSSEFESPVCDGSDEGQNPYLWGETNLLERLTWLAKDAVFAFKLRFPPREAIFLDRKMVGVFVIVSTLNLKMGPRKMIMSYLSPYLDGYKKL